MLEVIDRLIGLDAESPKRICVIGDAMIDSYVDGDFAACQDGCPCFREASCVFVPGGAAGAARQLKNWDAEAWLISPGQFNANDFNPDLCFRDGRQSAKIRFLHGGKIVFRLDRDVRPSENAALRQQRELALKAVREMRFDAVLISDYDKGFLSEELIREIVSWCRKNDVPVVSDCKRSPEVYAGSVLKFNEAYQSRFPNDLPTHASRGGVLTLGGNRPFVWLPKGLLPLDCEQARVECRNHVGAGDCFAAHLTLGLAHGLTLGEAALVAHAAGRVYVQHPHGRPPWPHEIRKDVDPAGGKVVPAAWAGRLWLSCPRPVVFTNGVFRLPTAAHCENLRWAKARGKTLVVGVNDDTSAFRVKKGGYCLPLGERLEVLASLECVDWLVPFSEDTPAELCRLLKPDLLVKGPEEGGTVPPGGEFAGGVRFYPGGHFAARHASTLIEEVRGG